MKVKIEVGENTLNFEIRDETKLSDFIRDIENVVGKYEKKTYKGKDIDDILNDKFFNVLK